MAPVTKVRAIVLWAVDFGVFMILGTKFSRWMDRADNAWAYADPPLAGG